MSVRMEQFGSHWTDFDKISYLSVFRKAVEKFLPLLLLLPLRWHYSPMRTSASSMDYSQLALFFGFLLQFVILRLLISVHNSAICVLVVLLVDVPEDYC